MQDSLPGLHFSFILSAFALQAAVPPVGVVLGLPVWLVLVILTCFAAGVVLGIYEVCIPLGATSKRVSSIIGKVEQKTAKYPLLLHWWGMRKQRISLPLLL